MVMTTFITTVTTITIFITTVTIFITTVTTTTIITAISYNMSDSDIYTQYYSCQCDEVWRVNWDSPAVVYAERLEYLWGYLCAMNVIQSQTPVIYSTLPLIIDRLIYWFLIQPFENRKRLILAKQITFIIKDNLLKPVEIPSFEMSKCFTESLSSFSWFSALSRSRLANIFSLIAAS